MTNWRVSMVLWSVIDTETTGLFDEDYAISFGTLIADVDTYKNTIECIDSMYSLIRIPNPLMTNKTKFIHGIRSEDIANAPEPFEVCGQYTRLLRQYNFKHAAAWNQSFDRRYLEKLFRQADIKLPLLEWIEMQPFTRARLDTHAGQLKCMDIRRLSGHHALKDCARALGVYAEYNGYTLDVPSLIRTLQTL